MKKIFISTAISAVALSLFTMCAPKTEKIEVGSTWKLEKFMINDSSITIPANIAITLNFVDSTSLAGNGGCNYYFGTYKVGEKNNITLTPAGITRMACPEMDLEMLYINALPTIKEYYLKNKTLYLKDQGGKESMVFIPLAELAEGTDSQK